MRGLHIWAAGAAISALILALGLWLVLSPGWAVTTAQNQLRQELGRTLTVKGGARLEFSPLSAVFADASISGAEGDDGSFIAAKVIRIPLSAWQILTHRLDFSSVSIENADIAFLVDERGAANWTFPKDTPRPPLRLEITGSRFRYYDSRNQQAFETKSVNADVEVSADGEIAIAGTSEIRGRLARIEASLKSLPRVHGEGSPLAVSVELPELSATFDGRLSTAKALSLTGPVNISMPSLTETARWAGLGFEEDSRSGPMTLSGGLDSAGRAFAIRDATVTFDTVALTGDVVLDARNATPKLQARLAAAGFPLDRFLPASGAKPGEWGTASLSLGVLRDFDAEVTLETPALSFGALKGVPARLVAMLSAGTLKASIASRPGDAANLSLDATIDGKAAAAAVDLSFTSEGLAAETILPAIAGINWLSGSGIIQAKLTGIGNSQQEIIGTLKGTASLALTGGRITGIDVQKSLSTASQRIAEGWSEGGSPETPFRTLSGAFSIADGIATTSSLKLVSPALSVTAEGDIDLLRRAVDLRADPKLVNAGDGSVTGLPVKLIVKGPWGSPRIYPDIDGILNDPAKAFGTLRSMDAASGN